MENCASSLLRQHVTGASTVSTSAPVCSTTPQLDAFSTSSGRGGAAAAGASSANAKRSIGGCASSASWACWSRAGHLTGRARQQRPPAKQLIEANCSCNEKFSCRGRWHRLNGLTAQACMEAAAARRRQCRVAPPTACLQGDAACPSPPGPRPRAPSAAPPGSQSPAAAGRRRGCLQGSRGGDRRDAWCRALRQRCSCDHSKGSRRWLLQHQHQQRQQLRRRPCRPLAERFDCTAVDLQGGQHVAPCHRLTSDAGHDGAVGGGAASGLPLDRNPQAGRQQRLRQEALPHQHAPLGW